jgi:hypothetical protein
VFPWDQARDPQRRAIALGEEESPAAVGWPALPIYATPQSTEPAPGSYMVAKPQWLLLDIQKNQKVSVKKNVKQKRATAVP